MTRRPVRVQLRLWKSPDAPDRLAVVMHAGNGAVPLTAQEALAVADRLVDAAEQLMKQEAQIAAGS